MTEQLSLLPALTCAVIREIEAPARVPFVPRVRQVDFEFDASGPECEPRALDVVPLWLRLPDETGYLEMDRFGRVK